MINVTEAIQAINSNAKYKIVGSDIDTCEIEWFDTTAISKSDIKAKMAELKTAYDNNKYQRDRAAEYSSIKDQLDDIYHNGVDGWKTTLKAVKYQYPKE